MVTLTPWIFALLTILAPPERLARLPAWPNWSETAEQRTARYRSIADDVAAVVLEQPALFARDDDRRKTSALVIAIAFHESGFAPDVDLGPCYRGRDGKGSRCDAGRAACIMQIQGTAEDRRVYFADRRACISRGLVLIRRSFAACRALPLEQRLAAYASGNCYGGRPESLAMFASMRRLLQVPQAPREPR